MYEQKISWKKWAIAGLLLVVILVLNNVELSGAFIEAYYANGIYKGISYLLHLLFSWIPFSFGDIFYIFIVLIFLAAIIATIRSAIKEYYKTAGDYLFGLVISVESLIIIFYLFWGLNYYRPPAAQLLSMQDTSYTINDVKKVTGMIIDSANRARAAVGIADLTQSDDTTYAHAVKSVKRIGKISVQFKVSMPAVKSSLLSPLMNYMGVSGYYNPYTGEAQVNKAMPVFEKPFIACHEMSHQMGFGREDEANFVGYVAATHTTDRLMKYSAYYEASLEFLRYLRHRDTTAHRKLKALLSKGVREDIKTDSLFWTKYDGPLGTMSSRFYDGFLKANQQPAGLRTYNRMIRLTMAWYKKQGIY